jgi:hypothetical protein
MNNLLHNYICAGVISESYSFSPSGRGLHWSTFRLNLSALYGTGDARRGCVARVKGVLRGI